jgi:hypothetical protein
MILYIIFTRYRYEVWSLSISEQQINPMWQLADKINNSLVNIYQISWQLPDAVDNQLRDETEKLADKINNSPSRLTFLFLVLPHTDTV